MARLDLSRIAPVSQTGSTLARRRVLRVTSSLAALAATPMLCAQTQHPARPLRLIMPFPVGTSPHVIARLCGATLEGGGKGGRGGNRPDAGPFLADDART